MNKKARIGMDVNDSYRFEHVTIQSLLLFAGNHL